MFAAPRRHPTQHLTWPRPLNRESRRPTPECPKASDCHTCERCVESSGEEAGPSSVIDLNEVCKAGCWPEAQLAMPWCRQQSSCSGITCARAASILVQEISQDLTRSAELTDFDASKL